MIDRTYRASDRYPFFAGAVTAAALLAMGFVLILMMGSVLQWRSDMRAEAQAADASRAAAARVIQVGALR